MRQIQGRPVAAAAATMAVVGLLTGQAAMASASTQARPEGTVSSAPADGDSHCVARLTGSGSAETQCFASFAEALQNASGGRLTEGPKNAGSALRDPAFIARVEASNDQASRARSAAASTVISIEYAPSGWVGSDLIWVGTQNCTTSTNNTDYEVSSMPAGWDNVISSYRTFANCWVKHYENTSFGGASVGYHGSRSFIGAAMDNRTSSQRWS
jgi:hypothetical protein